jgi:hypothetical protein
LGRFCRLPQGGGGTVSIGVGVLAVGEQFLGF